MLFEAYQLGGINLSKRIVMGPMTRCRAAQPGNVPTALMAEHYAQRASAGLIVSEGAPVSPQGHGYLWTPGIYTPPQVQGWQLVTEAVHGKGGHIFAQIWHVGRVSHVSLQENGQAPVSAGGTAAQARLTFTGAGTLNVRGNFGSGGTLATVAGSVINFNGSSAQTAGIYTTYNVLKSNNTAGVTLLGASTVATLTIGDVTTNSVFNTGAFQLTSTGTLNLTSGTFKLGAGTATVITWPAFATNNISAGTTVEYSTSGTLAPSITPTYSNLTFSRGAGIKTPAAGTLTANGILTIGTGVTLAMGTNNLTCGGLVITGTLTKGQSSPGVTVNGNVSGAGTITTGGTARFFIVTGNWTFSGTSSTSVSLTLNGTGAQTLSGVINQTGATNGALIINKTSGTVTLGSNITVFGSTASTFTMTAGTFDASTFLLTATTPTLTAGTLRVGAATWATNYSFTPTPPAGFTIEYYNTTPTINGAITYQNLQFSGTGTAGASATLIVQGNLTNTGGGTLNFGANAVTLSGAVATNSIAGFTTTGLVSMTKTAGTATFTGNVNGGGLTINGSLGTLNLGTGLTHTFTGTWTRTAGTLNGGSSTLNLGGTVSGTGGTFTAGTGTVNYNGAAQAIAAVTYNNLTINQSSGNATLGAAATVNGTLTLTAGNLAVTDPQVLTMGASATTLGAKDVTGIVTRTSMVAGTSYTFGNQYTAVTFASGGTIPTSFSIKISIGSAPSWKTGAIQRYYDIIQSGGSGTLALNLHYLDTELNGNAENTLVQWDWHTPSTTEEHGRSNYDTTNNWVGTSGIAISYFPTAFGSKAWTLANSALSSATWNGITSTDWSISTNWTPNGIPSATADVVIPDASTTAFDPTTPATVSVGRMTISANGILNAATGSTITISGGNGAWSNNGGTFNHGTGTVIFTNAAATISGITDFYNVTINSGAGLQPGTGNIMRIGGTLTNNGTFEADDLVNTVEYNGGSQTVLSPNGATPGYYNLILSGSGTKTMPGTALSILGNFSMSGSASATAGNAITASGSFTIGSLNSFAAGAFSHTIGGDFSNSGTFTATGSTITLNGTADQLINGSTATTFNNLTINKASGGVTLGNSPTVGGTLTLTSGKITTGANTLIINSTGNVFGGGSSSYVIGNLQKWVAIGATSITFEVGEVSDYDPVSLTFTGVSVAGNLTALVTNTEHPNIATSTINPSKDVNDYWTLTNSGITFTSYSATFTFASGDVDADAVPSAFIVGRYSSGWTYPTVGTRTSTSTQATGLTLFGDFVVGQSISWESYSDLARTNVSNNFTVAGSYVYMKGTGFNAATSGYNVAYYDATVTGGGNNIMTDASLTVAGDGILNSLIRPSDFPSAAVGDPPWHALVQLTGATSFPATYNAAVAAPETYGLLANDSFTVQASAIPEFPTVMAGIAVAGLCAAVYYWMRRRRLAYVKA